MLNFVVACLTIIAGAIPGPQDGNSTSAQVYGSEAPYGNVASSRIVKPPKGYSLFFVETVGRHGSRTSIPSEENPRILKLWEQAKKDNALTETGENLKADIEQFKADEKELGAGQLTSLGKNELHGLGRRTADNYADFFRRVQEDGDEIAFVTSNMKRTKDSAAAMKSAIDGAVPGPQDRQGRGVQPHPPPRRQGVVHRPRPHPTAQEGSGRQRSREQHPGEHLPAGVHPDADQGPGRGCHRLVPPVPAGAGHAAPHRRDVQGVSSTTPTARS